MFTQYEDLVLSELQRRKRRKTGDLCHWVALASLFGGLACSSSDENRQAQTGANITGTSLDDGGASKDEEPSSEVDSSGATPENDSKSSGGEASGGQSGGEKPSGSDDEESSDESGKEDSDTQESGAPLRFDVGRPDVGLPPDWNETEFSYIWIANSTQGTVSKVNTIKVREDGRYVTRPDQRGDPSRTSVNLTGDVAVANRAGGITKIYARPDRCEDQNGDKWIDTVHDANYLPWGEDECVAWYVPMAFGSQRAIAWTSGVLDPDTGERSGEQLWVTGNSHDKIVDVILLDGQDGSEVGRRQLDGAHDALKLANYPYSSYGGAVDAGNNFWFTDNGFGAVIRVDIDDFSVLAWEHPLKQSYGFTIDPRGRPWTCWSHVGRLDPSTGDWEVREGNFGHASIERGEFGGCMIDGERRLWHSVLLTDGKHAMAGFDIDSMNVVKLLPMPSHAHGVSIDFEGYVWGVQLQGNRAYKLHPDSGFEASYDNLVGAYTYSDMTGFALSSVQESVG